MFISPLISRRVLAASVQVSRVSRGYFRVSHTTVVQSRLQQKATVCHVNENTRLSQIKGSEFGKLNQCRHESTAQQTAVTGDSHSKILSSQTSEATGNVIVRWSDGDENIYPSVWLRDNCQCSTCFHPVSKARLILMQNLDIDTKPLQVQVTENAEAIEVVWSDRHLSVFSASWLKARAFTKQGQETRQSTCRQKPHLWGEEMIHNLYTLDFDDILACDWAVYNWLQNLEIYGLVLIENAPQEPGQVKVISERIGFQKETHYGKAFTVMNKWNPNNLAYTTATLGVHTDLPFYDYIPGTQFLHCIKQYNGKGGENLLVDGFNVATQLEKLDAAAFHVLTTFPVSFCDVGVETIPFNKVINIPVIKKDENGELKRISYNNQTRDSFLNLDPEQVYPLYKAMKLFDKLCYSTKNKIKLKLKPGDILTFDNLRILHGREGYNANTQGIRHLEGAYVDWDEIRSTIRALREKLRIEKCKNESPLY